VENSIRIQATVRAMDQTGVEMEALTAASVACLTIYDMIKYLNDPEVEISGIRLIEKKGGKSDRNKFTKTEQQAALLICSEDILSGRKSDRVSPIITELLSKNNCSIADNKIISGLEEDIREQIITWVDKGIPFIFTAGGTGLGEKDQVFEAVSKLVEKDLAGITDAMRLHGQLRTPLAMLSRTIAGTCKKSIIITLPGSSNGAKESLEAILPTIFQAYKMLKIKRN